MHSTDSQKIDRALSRESSSRAIARRENRLLVLIGTGCTTLGVVCLLLAACATVPAKPEPATIPRPQAATPTTIPAPLAPSVAIPTPATPSPWQRLRQRFVMADCEYGPRVEIWARRYSSNAAALSASLRRAMPFLLLVIDQIEQRDMPGEFALLPYVESNYLATASGGRAAGIWQLMPATARANGLRVSADFDARLDVPASTAVALDLLQRYHEKFKDWRLADMAFNAGEYRVRKLISDRSKRHTSAELRQLDLTPETHAHLSRLMALACIIDEPQRFNVKLPEPEPDDAVAVVELPAPVDLQLAASLSGIDTDQLRQLNPGYLDARMSDQSAFQLVVPAVKRDGFVANLGKLPQTLWRDWHVMILQHPEPLVVLATAHAVQPQVLAAANLIAEDSQLAVGTRVLLPGVGKTRQRRRSRSARSTSISAAHHVVRMGDTLSSIALNAHVSVNDLCHWNDINRHDVLRPGRQLRLKPDVVDTSTSAADSAPAD